METYVGGTVIFNCESTSHTEWRFNNGPLPSNARKLSQTKLIVVGVALSNYGSYECEGTAGRPVFEQFTARAFLTVFGE